MTISKQAPATLGHRAPGAINFKHAGTTAFDERYVDKHLEERRQQQAGGRIRCPHCNWQPPRSSRWFCISIGPPENYASGCGHGWNTFDTRGQCPGCAHHWHHTSCLSCNKWAKHDDWYV